MKPKLKIIKELETFDSLDGFETVEADGVVKSHVGNISNMIKYIENNFDDNLVGEWLGKHTRIVSWKKV